MTNSEVKTKSKSKMGLIIILIVIVLVLCICISCGAILWLSDSNPDNDGTDTFNSSNGSSGVSEGDYQPSDFEGVNALLFDYHENLATLIQYDRNMIYAASVEDADSFFDNYDQFNMVAEETLMQAETLSMMFDLYSEPVGMNTENLLIQKVYAKERYSWWYHVPIIGSLVKAKHQSIETSRSGIYDYMKNDLEQVDRQAFLDAYNLNSVEDLRDASDSTVEKLARDPELNAAVDWKKVTTDLGKTAVETVVEANQAVLGGENPFTPSGYAENVVKDIIEKGKLDTVSDEMPKAKVKTTNSNQTNPALSQKVTIATSNKVQTTIESTVSNSVGRSWSQIPTDIQNKVTKAIIDESHNGPVIVSHDSEGVGGETFDIPVGDWDMVVADEIDIPAFADDFQVQTGEINIIDAADYGLPPNFDPDFWGSGWDTEITDPGDYGLPPNYDPNTDTTDGTWDGDEVYHDPDGYDPSVFEDPEDTGGEDYQDHMEKLKDELGVEDGENSGDSGDDGTTGGDPEDTGCTDPLTCLDSDV
ncbi:hypothetical protein GF362_03875 [Candidatus Dojkabacteria bacterium]|nr:hypothetical protein [Candidatus Dojkabacteria bacterium]